MNEQNGLYGKSMQSIDYLVPLNTPMRSISIGFALYLTQKGDCGYVFPLIVSERS